MKMRSGGRQQAFLLWTCLLLVVSILLVTLGPSPVEGRKPTRKKASSPARTARARAPKAAVRGSLASVTWARVRVDGKLAPYQAAVVGGVSYIPLKAAAESLRARIEWDPTTDAVAVNGGLLRAQPWHYKGNVYLPVGALSRLLKIQVAYNRTSRLLAIGKGATVAVTPRPPSPRPSPVATRTPPPTRGWRQPFAPQTATDGVFTVTVTDLQELEVIKGYYRPRPGAKFVMVNLSQQNISSDLQIYTGRFVLVDEHGQVYDPLENLSNFWLVILRPGGMNFGYLMYEIPTATRAARLVLDTRDRSPLTVNLR